MLQFEKFLIMSFMTIMKEKGFIKIVDLHWSLVNWGDNVFKVRDYNLLYAYNKIV